MLHTAVAEKVREQRKTCKECKAVLAEKIPKADMNWEAVTCFCGECRSYLCGEVPCENVLSCDICMGHFCRECKWVTFCSICDNAFCEECRYTGTCYSEKCDGNEYCEQCRETFPCLICDKSWCTECRAVAYCEGCEISCCTECRQVKECETCERVLCTECDPVEYCRSCGNDHCKDCRKKWCHLGRKTTRSLVSQNDEGGEHPAKRART